MPAIFFQPRLYHVPAGLFILLVFLSCQGYKPAQFPVSGTTAVLLAKDRSAQNGEMDFSSQKKLEYRFEDSFTIPPDSSFQIEYEFTSPVLNEKHTLILDTGTASWQLPVDYSSVFVYAVPLDDNFNGSFSISVESTEKIEKKSAPVFKIRSVSFTKRFFGFSNIDANVFTATPFVYKTDSGYSIDVPASLSTFPLLSEIEASFSSEGAALEFAGIRMETISGTDKLRVPAAMYPVEGQITITGNNIESFFVNFDVPPAFPIPVSADPALVIGWPRERWRNSNYEVFRWDRFPSLLIFDYANYAVQDRMLKRLAFFVEKAGFTGRIAYDHEIAHLHAWNAHDYRAEDLAAFFYTVRSTGFLLLDEELELEKILLNEGIILETPEGITAGSGGIISITRESPDYLRYRFMVHEGFHGLFFIDEDFRDFCRRRWQQLDTAAKRFITSFFDFQQYDTGSEYLLINEFMAHVLQQPVSQAAEYFGRQLPQRLESTWRVSSLPPKDEAANSWPSLAEVFTQEAEAFSAYVNNRWGLAAGRVWTLRIR